MLFFVSVGMLFDPWVLLERPLQVLAVVGIIIVGKTLAAGALVMAFRYPLNTALTVSASLAQIGEFSFILVGMGASLDLLPPEGQSLILAGALISIALNQLVFKGIEPLQNWILSKSLVVKRLNAREDPMAQLPLSTEEKYLSQHVVLVGYGRVGQAIAKALEARQIPLVVVEQNRELVEKLRAKDIAAVAGDALEIDVLIQAHVAQAKILVMATSDTLDVRQIISSARALNPGIETVMRTDNETEAELLNAEKAGKVFFAEHELAQAMTRHVLVRSVAELVA